MPTNQTIPKSRNTTRSLRFSLRLSNQKVTSVSINTNIVILFLLFHPKLQQTNPEKIKFPTSSYTAKAIVTDYMISCLSKWNQNSGKGLSDWMTDKLLQYILGRCLKEPLQVIDFVKLRKILIQENQKK